MSDVSEAPKPAIPSAVNSDVPFFLVLGLIGGTYVILILGILLADLAYIVSVDQSQSLDVDFARDDADRRIPSGSRLTSQFDRYGLKIHCEQGGNQQALVIDNLQQYVVADNPAQPKNPQVSKSEQLAMLSKNVLVAPSPAQDGQPELSKPVRYVFSWSKPVSITQLRCINIRGQSDVTVVTRNAAGEEINRQELRPNRAPVQLQTFTWSDEQEVLISRLEVNLPAGGGVTGLRFVWGGYVPGRWEARFPFLSRLIHNPFTTALSKPEIRYSIRLSLISCTITALLSLWVAIPIGYLMSRFRFFGHSLLDAILDIPIVLPPLVIGLSLLIAFQFLPVPLREWVVYEIPAVILAQFMVACAFAVRTMRATFDQIDVRREHVALTLGCSRCQAFLRVVLPEASRGTLTAATLAWARALGEFGPLLIFAGATRNKTEVLSTTVFLEMNVGDLGAAVAVSLIMVTGAVLVLIVARVWGTRGLTI